MDLVIMDGAFGIFRNLRSHFSKLSPATLVESARPRNYERRDKTWQQGPLSAGWWASKVQHSRHEVIHRLIWGVMAAHTNKDMKKRIHWITFAAILLSGVPFAGQSAVPTFEWAISSGGHAETWDITMDQARNLYIVGDALPFSRFGPYDLGVEGEVNGYLVKYSPAGEPVWSFRSSGPVQMSLNTVCPATDGVYVGGMLFEQSSLKGSTFDFGTNTYTVSAEHREQGIIARMDSNGEPQWVVTFGGSGDEGVFNSARDSQNNLLCVARSNSGSFQVRGIDIIRTNPAPHFALLVMKWKPDGDILWTKVLETDGRVVSEAIATDAANNVVCAGKFSGSSLTVGDTTIPNTGVPPGGGQPPETAFVFKLSSAGEPLWLKPLAMARIHPLSIAVDSQNNIIVGGSSGTLEWGGLVEKFSAAGASLWSVTMESPNLTGVHEVGVDHEDNLFVVGVSSEPSSEFNGLILNETGGENGFLIKTRPDGTPLWAAPMNGTAYQFVYGLSVDHEGAAYVLGWFDQQTLHFGPLQIVNDSEQGHLYSYLAKLAPEPPRLRHNIQAGQLTLSWPTNQPSFELEANSLAFDPMSWENIPSLETNGRNVTTTDLAGPGTVFRLRKTTGN
jgi:hypothetical protein